MKTSTISNVLCANRDQETPVSEDEILIRTSLDALEKVKTDIESIYTNIKQKAMQLSLYRSDTQQMRKAKLTSTEQPLIAMDYSDSAKKLLDEYYSEDDGD